MSNVSLIDGHIDETRMTDNDIIKVFKDAVICVGQEPFVKRVAKGEHLKSGIVELINRQKAEIKRLQKQLGMAESCINEVEDAAYRGGSNDYIDKAIEEYNNAVRDMK